MKHLSDISIEKKLRFVTSVTTLLALLLAGTAFVLYDMYSYRKTLSDDLSTTAEVLGMNCTAALAFKDHGDARELLSGLLAKPRICAAAVYDSEGMLFASFKRKDNSLALPRHAPPPGDMFTKTHLSHTQSVHLEGTQVGSIYLGATLDELRSRQINYIVFMVLFTLGTLLVSLILTGRLHHVISTPIMNLAKAVSMVTHTKDYAIRVEETGRDEVGQLMEGFNDMLSEIQSRDVQLTQHRRNLEREVLERTEQLRKAVQTAEHANHAKSQFLANMSHELRTPLNAILGYSEMLEEEAEETGMLEVVPDLQKIRAAGRHLLSLINDILDLSKIEAEQMSLDIMPFSIRAMVHEVTATVQPLLEQNRNELEVILPSDPGVAVSDMKRIRQILLNLLSNAAKFTEGGKVQLEIKRERAASGRPMLVFVVTDSGIGIPGNMLDKIFEPFTQADSSTTRKYEGTGLGLSICQHLCNMMKGSIEVTSTPGQGTVFTVKLPAKLDDEHEEPK